MSNKSLNLPSSGKIAIPGRNNEFFEPKDISTTPGGTIFGTTPGGTRIVYDRHALLSFQNSPLSKTPPPKMVHIPGITLNTQPPTEIPSGGKVKKPQNEEDKEDMIFSMDN